MRNATTKEQANKLRHNSFYQPSKNKRVVIFPFILSLFHIYRNEERHNKRTSKQTEA